MTTIRLAEHAGFFPALSGSYMVANAGYTGVELNSYRTVSLWIKVPTVSGIPIESTNASLVYWGHDPPSGVTHGRVWSCELKNGKPRLWIRGAHTTVDSNLEGRRAVVDDGNWHLLVYQFSHGSAIEDVEFYIDDMGPLDTKVFGAGTIINSTAAVNSNPLTLGARNLNSIVSTSKRDILLDQIAIWDQPLTSQNISLMWNRGYDGGGGLTITGSDGTPGKEINPSALSGTISLNAWYTFESPHEFTTTVNNSTASGSRNLDVLNGATWIYDTPASGIFG